MRQRRAPAGTPPVRADSDFIRVQLERVSLTLQGRSILRGIDWEIRPGQRWVLLGANGAGKTLLLKLLAGDVWPSSGRSRRRYYCGAERFDEPYGIKQHIAYIGAERQDRYERYDWNQRVEDVVGTGLYHTDVPLDALTAQDRARIESLLHSLDLAALTRRRLLTLSYGERRLVLLARALAGAPKLLLLDELLNGLDPRNRARALACLATISRSALPWVLTTHRADDLPASATHCCRLAGGRIRTLRASSGDLRERAPARPSGGGSSAAAAGHRLPGPLPSRASSKVQRGPGRPVLTLSNVTVWREGTRALHGLSLVIRSGECWVVHGANGSGKSTFMQLLYGDLGAASGGMLTRAGLERGAPIAQFKERVGLVSPELQALYLRDARVDEVVASGRRASVGYDGRIDGRTRARVRQALRRMHMAALEARRFGTLSYGQARRVLFARALIFEPDILLLDEPYCGLDPLTRTRLQALIEQAVDSGLTVVIATHHRDDWPAGATHELELVQGQAHYCGPVRVGTARRNHGAGGMRLRSAAARPPSHRRRAYRSHRTQADAPRAWWPETDRAPDALGERR